MRLRDKGEQRAIATPAQKQAHGPKTQSRRQTQIGGFVPADLRAPCEQRPLSRNHHDRAAAMRCLARKTGEFGLIQF
jgi:hypothetical protein